MPQLTANKKSVEQLFIFTPSCLADINSLKLWLTCCQQPVGEAFTLLHRCPLGSDPGILVTPVLLLNPNSHQSSLSTLLSLSLVTRLLKLFKPTIHLDEWTRWMLRRYTVRPGDRFTGVTWRRELWSSSQMATVSQDQPPGLLSHVPSWLAAVVSLLNDLTVSYDRSQELCEPWELPLLRVSVYFPSAGI